MGVFIRNKSKKIESGKKPEPILTNKTENPEKIGIENKTPDKRSIKVGLADNRSKSIKQESKVTKTINVDIKHKAPEKINKTSVIEVKVDDNLNTPKEEFNTKELSLFEKVNLNIDKVLLDNEVNLSFMDLTAFANFISGKTIALVANSSDLLNHNHGDKIDSHDVVIRFNSFKIDKEYTGIKTTIHVSIHLQDVNLDYPTTIRFIVANNLTKWAKKIKSLNKFKQTFILKYNHPISFGIDHKRQLTTGINTLLTLLKIGGYKKINLFGFTFYKDWDNSILRSDGGLAYPISKVHDYEYERALISGGMAKHDKKNNIITFNANSSL